MPCQISDPQETYSCGQDIQSAKPENWHCRNVGNDRAVMMDLITQLLPWVGYPRTLNAMRCLNEITSA